MIEAHELVAWIAQIVAVPDSVLLLFTLLEDWFFILQQLPTDGQVCVHLKSHLCLLWTMTPNSGAHNKSRVKFIKSSLGICVCHVKKLPWTQSNS